MNVKIPCILRGSQMAKDSVIYWKSLGECNQTRLQSIGWCTDHFLDRIDTNSDSLRSKHLCAHFDQQIQKYEWNLRTVVWFRYESWLSSSVMRDGWMERTIIAESHGGRTERIENVWWVEKGCVAMCISLLKKKHEWCCTAFWMQNEKECGKKKEKKKKGERDGWNCRDLWCMKQCRIWKRLGNVFG